MFFSILRFMHALFVVHAKAVIGDVRRVVLGSDCPVFCKIRLPAPRLSPIVDFESNYFQKVETLKLQKQNSVYQRTKTDWKGVRRSGNNLSDISCSYDILVQL